MSAASYTTDISVGSFIWNDTDRFTVEELTEAEMLCSSQGWAAFFFFHPICCCCCFWWDVHLAKCTQLSKHPDTFPNIFCMIISSTSFPINTVGSRCHHCNIMHHQAFSSYLQNNIWNQKARERFEMYPTSCPQSGSSTPVTLVKISVREDEWILEHLLLPGDWGSFSWRI